MVLSRDQQTLVILNADQGKLMDCVVWNMSKNKLSHSVQVPSNLPNGRLFQAVSADCRLLVLSTTNDNLRGNGPHFLEFWDLQAGKLNRKIETEDVMRKLALSPDGKFLAASTGESMLRVYEVGVGTEKHNLRLPLESVNHLEFSLDSVSLFTVNYLGQITRWNTAKGQREATYQTPSEFCTPHLSCQADG